MSLSRMHMIITRVFREPKDSAALTAALSEFYSCVANDGWAFYARDFGMSPRMSLLYCALHRGLDFRL